MTEDQALPGADDEEDASFSFSLGFAGAACPTCGRIGPAGKCPTCGDRIPEPEDLGESASVRREILLPLRDRAETLYAEFDDLRTGSVPITAPAFLSGFTEADLLDEVRTVIDLGHAIAGLDLDDPAVIRGALRAAVELRVAAAERALARCQELAYFAAQPPADRLQTAAFGIGRKGLRLLLAYLAALTAVDIPAARDAQRELQAELDAFEFESELAQVFDEMTDVPVGINARIGHALGREGLYTDAHGNVDFGQVFGAFADSANVFLALGRRAVSYFASLVEVDLDADQEAGAALLAIPLIGIVSASKPLTAHRAARESYELFAAAVAIDAQAVASVADDASSQGAQLFAALGRLRTAFFELSNLGHQDDDSDLNLFFAAAISAYRELIEVSWTLQGRVLLRLDAIRRLDSERELPATDDLGGLHAELAASSTPALRDFAASLDLELLPALTSGDLDAIVAAAGRDAEHADDPARVIEDVAERLLAAIAGADAGYSLGISAHTLNLHTPAWMASGEQEFATEVVATAMLGAAGARLVAAAADGSTLTVAPLEEDAELDPLRMLSAIAGMAAMFTETPHFSIVDEAGATFLELDGDAIRAAHAAPEHLKDLSVIACFREPLVARGEDEEPVVLALAATQMVAVVMPALEYMAAAPWDATVYRTLSVRLVYIRDFVRAHKVPGRTIRRMLDRIARATAAAQLAGRGDSAARGRLVDQLGALGGWGVAHARWPPL